MPAPTYKQLVQKIFAYRDSPGALPMAVLADLVSRIDRSYKTIGLMAVGAEGAIVAATDAAGNKVVFKIASAEYSEPGKKLTARGDGYGFFGKVIDEETNKFQERFVAGSQLQKQLAEMIAAEKIDYFTVPRVYRISQDPGLFVEMEHLDGVQILRWIREKNSLKYSLNLFLRLLRAVDFYQNYGVVHRDLKSENILIAEGNKVSIVDWTMSKLVGEYREVTMAGVPIRMGTVPYAAPEIVIDGTAREANYASDVFGLGIILYEFCALEKVPRPKNASVLKEDKQAIRRYCEHLSERIPAPLQEVFRKATEIEEEKRYQTAEPMIVEFIEALKALDLLDEDGVWDYDTRSTDDIVKDLAVRVGKLEQAVMKIFQKFDLSSQIYQEDDECSQE